MQQSTTTTKYCATCLFWKDKITVLFSIAGILSDECHLYTLHVYVVCYTFFIMLIQPAL